MEDTVEIVETTSDLAGTMGKTLLINVAAVAIGYGIGWGIVRIVSKQALKKANATTELATEAV